MNKHIDRGTETNGYQTRGNPASFEDAGAGMTKATLGPGIYWTSTWAVVNFFGSLV